MTEKEQKYREDPALNYSLLSKLDQDVRRIVREEDDVTKYQTFGSIVDKLLFEKQDFFNDFYIVDFQYPSDNIKAIVDHLFEEQYEGMSGADDAIKIKAAEIGYGQSWKPETLVKKVVDQGGNYLKKLWETVGYKIITQDEYNEAMLIIDMLKYHPFTEHILNVKGNKDYEVFSQEPLFATIGGIKYKGLLDHLIVNHKDKQVYPYDLKTTSSNKFASDVVKYRYYLQAALYRDLVEQNYPQYTIDNFTFIVARRGNINNPLLYECTDGDIKMGRDGGVNPNTGKWIKGYKQLAEEYYWHQKHDKWDDPKEIYDKNGVITLDLFQDKQLKSA